MPTNKSYFTVCALSMVALDSDCHMSRSNLYSLMYPIESPQLVIYVQDVEQLRLQLPTEYTTRNAQ